MTILHWIVLGSWVVFIGYWGISAIGVKKDVKPKFLWSGWGIAMRFMIGAALIIFILAFHSANIEKIFEKQGYSLGVAAAVTGAVLAVSGILFAIWARTNLGRNWSSYPSLKENHELVTSGPYKFVRHPIYTGVIFEVFGAALVSGLAWFLFAIFVSIILIRRIPIEENIMKKEFPGKYEEYQRHTKALIPFIW